MMTFIIMEKLRMASKAHNVNKCIDLNSNLLNLLFVAGQVLFFFFFFWRGEGAVGWGQAHSRWKFQGQEMNILRAVTTLDS